MGAKKDEQRERTDKVIRLSKKVTDYIAKRRHKGESYDSCLRRHFGLADRRGKPQELATFFLLPNGGNPIAKLTLAEARGEAIVQATKKRLGIKKAEAVIMVREVPEKIYE